jgi:hypothetical protein
VPASSHQSDPADARLGVGGPDDATPDVGSARLVAGYWLPADVADDLDAADLAQTTGVATDDGFFAAAT